MKKYVTIYHLKAPKTPENKRLADLWERGLVTRQALSCEVKLVRFWFEAWVTDKHSTNPDELDVAPPQMRQFLERMEHRLAAISPKKVFPRSLWEHWHELVIFWRTVWDTTRKKGEA